MLLLNSLWLELWAREWVKGKKLTITGRGRSRSKSLSLSLSRRQKYSEDESECRNHTVWYVTNRHFLSLSLVSFVNLIFSLRDVSQKKNKEKLRRAAKREPEWNEKSYRDNKSKMKELYKKIVFPSPGNVGSMGGGPYTYTMWMSGAESDRDSLVLDILHNKSFPTLGSLKIRNLGLT